SMVVRSSNVSLTSKTIRGRETIFLHSDLFTSYDYCCRPGGMATPEPVGSGVADSQVISLSAHPGSAAPRGPSAPRPHPCGDRPPDLVRRIFLDEMDPRHRLLGQRWPPADEVDQRIIGEDRTWLGLQKQLGHIARPEPVRVFSRDRMHISGLARDGD